jgi:hypothetical protein
LAEGAGDRLSVGDMQHKGEASTNRRAGGVGNPARADAAFESGPMSGPITGQFTRPIDM